MQSEIISRVVRTRITFIYVMKGLGVADEDQCWRHVDVLMCWSVGLC